MIGWLLVIGIVLNSFGFIYLFGAVFWYLILRFIWLALFESGREQCLARMMQIYCIFHDENGKYTDDPAVNLRIDLHISFIYHFVAYFGPAIFLGYKIATTARDFMNKPPK